MELELAPCRRCGSVVHRTVGGEHFKCARCGLVVSVSFRMSNIPAAEPERPARPEAESVPEPEPEPDEEPLRRVGRRRRRRRRVVVYVLPTDPEPASPGTEAPVDDGPAGPSTQGRRVGRRRRRRRRPVAYVPAAGESSTTAEREPAAEPLPSVTTPGRSGRLGRWTWRTHRPAELEPELEPEAEPEAELEPEPDPEPVLQPEPEPEPEPIPEPEPEPEPQPMPVFRLDDGWTGARRVGRVMKDRGQVVAATVVHGEPNDAGDPFVRVETRRDTSWWLGTRHPVDLLVDGEPVRFGWSGEGAGWMAFAEHEGVAIVISSLALPVEAVRLVRVDDPVAFLAER